MLNYSRYSVIISLHNHEEGCSKFRLISLHHEIIHIFFLNVPRKTFPLVSQRFVWLSIAFQVITNLRCDLKLHICWKQFCFFENFVVDSQTSLFLDSSDTVWIPKTFITPCICIISLCFFNYFKSSSFSIKCYQSLPQLILHNAEITWMIFISQYDRAQYRLLPLRQILFYNRLLHYFRKDR